MGLSRKARRAVHGGMVMPAKFLLIDSDAHRRSLIVRTLERHFSGATVYEGKDMKEAKLATVAPRVEAVIGVASETCDASALIHLVRKMNERIPILVMADLHDKTPLIAEGATAFLRREEWLLAGATLRRILKGEPQRHYVTFPDEG